MNDNLKIGELAKLTHCPIQTIRFYEKEGLLMPPTRGHNNYRAYNDAHMERLIFIRHCRSLDMALEEIRILLKFRDLPQENCTDVNALLDKHITHVATRIAELVLLEKQLKKLRRSCRQAQKAKDCGILQELSRDIAGR